MLSTFRRGRRLLLLSGLAGAAPVLAQRPTDERLRISIDSMMQGLVARDRFQGAVVVGRGDSVLYRAGFGFADRDARVPFTPDTPTDAASIAKTFTAAGLLALAHEGRVKLDDRVTRWLPTFPYPDVRLRHLLTHAVGLPDYDYFDSLATPGDVRTNEGHLELLARTRPALPFRAGTGSSYDNVAYDLAATVIERVSGKPYASVMAERFFNPLQLSAFLRPARFSAWSGTRTRGYRRTAAGLVDHDAYDLEGFYGADNIYISANDLQRWAAGYRRTLSPPVFQAALAPGRLDDGRRTGITAGSWYATADGRERYYTGHHNGFFSLAYSNEATGITLAWVANDMPPFWLQVGLTRAILALVNGQRPEPLAPRDVREFTGDPSGSYRVAGLGTVRVRQRREAIQVTAAGIRYDAFPIEPGLHYVPGLDAGLRFVGSKGSLVLEWDTLLRGSRARRTLP
jgi:CubicO group peptidase (beta-lactamase class C family)